MQGILIVNKPQGLTSHDVVDKVRKKLNMRRVGHAGTLDPLATGVLVILVGKATKLFEKFVHLDKAYRATMIMGLRTDSADIQGKVLEEKDVDSFDEKKIIEAVKSFEGEIEQVPPMVSAVKVGGRKLYELAREGKTVERSPRSVTIKRLDILRIDVPEVEIIVECSKGTYIRQLAEDIGEKLGCGACISRIQRTRVGDFRLDDAVNVEDIDEGQIRHWEG